MEWLRDPKKLRHIHVFLTIAWLVAVIPSVVWLRESVPWLVFMSVWANVAASWSAWQGARSEDAQGTD